MKDTPPDVIMLALARDDSGSWTCLHPIEFIHPTGRIQLAPGSRFSPGTSFMGVDLAKWLDERTAQLRLMDE